MLMIRRSHLLLRLAVCGGICDGFVPDVKCASLATSDEMKRQRKHQQVSNIQGKRRRAVGQPFVF